MKSFCVILTHRHGACIGLVYDKPELIKKNFLQTSCEYLIQRKSLVQTDKNFEYFYKKNSFAFGRILGKTAENLSNLFNFLCHVLNVNSNKMNDFNLIVGTGPGSFTGLRLGCAFANGLYFGSGSSANLFSVSTQLTNDLYNEFKSNDELIKILNDELQTQQTNDPSSGYVTFFDLFYAIHQIDQKQMTACKTFLPVYGNDPTPVLNLRKE